MDRANDGVEVRANSIRLFFVFEKRRHKETLKLAGKPLKPTAPNIQHAHRVAKEIRRQLQLGTFVLAEHFPDSPRAVLTTTTATFGDVADLWFAGKGRLARKTKDQYRNALQVWKGLFGADTPIAHLSHGKVSAKIGEHSWPSNKLLNNYLIPLRGVFSLAGRDLKVENPMEGISNGKHQAPAPDPLSVDETHQILADLAKHYPVPVWAYFEFAFATGMRPEEMIALRWADVDWNHEMIRVQRARTGGKSGPLKTYQTRDVDLTERAIGALKAMKPITFMADGDIFQNPVTGRPWHDERSQRDHYWQPALRRCGIRQRRAYQTRHTYAATALMGGVNPAYISRQMGHKNAQMLFGIYAKWIDGADRGREKAKLEAAAGPQEVPQDGAVRGRRDWTRTNSPADT